MEGGAKLDGDQELDYVTPHQVVVLYAYRSQTQGELSLQVGERITVQGRNHNYGWWFGINTHGTHGIFPANCVKAVPLQNNKYETSFIGRDISDDHMNTINKSLRDQKLDDHDIHSGLDVNSHNTSKCPGNGSVQVNFGPVPSQHTPFGYTTTSQYQNGQKKADQNWESIPKPALPQKFNWLRYYGWEQFTDQQVQQKYDLEPKYNASPNSLTEESHSNKTHHFQSWDRLTNRNLCNEGLAVPVLVNNQVNSSVLSHLLLNPEVIDLPVCVVAVVGEYRTGKSFILNYFLRYLQNQGSENWLGEPNAPLIGFEHKNTDCAVTKGINIWNIPHIVDTPSGKVAVLLLDSQGIYDEQAKSQESTMIFALSVMCSSTLIFNHMLNLNENCLSHLQLFTSFANLNQDASNKKPFQDLMFLIRDWKWPKRKPYGLEGGRELVETKLKVQENLPTEANEIRKYLWNTFENISCYLMPRPGDFEEEEEDFNGSLSGLTVKFKKHLKQLTEHLLSPCNLIRKSVGGQILTAGQFYTYFLNCVKVMNDNEQWNQPLNLLKVQIELNCNMARREGVKHYKTLMQEFLVSKRYHQSIELVEGHQRAIQQALHVFDSRSNYTRKNDVGLSEETKENLQREINGVFDKLKEINSEREALVLHEAVKLAFSQYDIEIWEVLLSKMDNKPNVNLSQLKDKLQGSNVSWMKKLCKDGLLMNLSSSLTDEELQGLHQATSLKVLKIFWEKSLCGDNRPKHVYEKEAMLKQKINSRYDEVNQINILKRILEENQEKKSSLKKDVKKAWQDWQNALHNYNWAIENSSYDHLEELERECTNLQERYIVKNTILVKFETEDKNRKEESINKLMETWSKFNCTIL
ncbi:unnamed protein product [Meganyctiphanes norvegica]|uniref:Guanylate-binding protein n=1 Tax=Meganyctiphanes norvegica TaxID=48144 RepID=A0AAV2QSX6_MEGNR